MNMSEAVSLSSPRARTRGPGPAAGLRSVLLDGQELYALMGQYFILKVVR